MSKNIELEILKATGQSTQKRNEHEQSYFLRLVKATDTSMTDEEFSRLSDESIEWINESIRCINRGDHLPSFGGTTPVKSNGDDSKGLSDIGIGKVVEIVGRKGKLAEGKVVGINEKKVVVEEDDGKKDIFISRITKVNMLKNETGDNIMSIENIAVGSEVSLFDGKGKEFASGKVLEVLTDDEFLVLEEEDGEELEVDFDEIEKFEMKDGDSGSDGEDDELDWDDIEEGMVVCVNDDTEGKVEKITSRLIIVDGTKIRKSAAKTIVEVFDDENDEDGDSTPSKAETVEWDDIKEGMMLNVNDGEAEGKVEKKSPRLLTVDGVRFKKSEFKSAEILSEAEDGGKPEGEKIEWDDIEEGMTISVNDGDVEGKVEKISPRILTVAGEKLKKSSVKSVILLEDEEDDDDDDEGEGDDAYAPEIEFLAMTLEDDFLDEDEDEVFSSWQGKGIKLPKSTQRLLLNAMKIIKDKDSDVYGGVKAVFEDL